MKYRVFDGSQKTKAVSARRVVRLFENGRISHDAKVIDENGKSITVAKFVSMVQDRMAGQIAKGPRDVPEPVVDTTDHVALQNTEETWDDDYTSDVAGLSALDDDDAELFDDDVGDFAAESDDALASSWHEREYPIVRKAP